MCSVANNRPHYSFVIPLYNEEEVFPELLKRLQGEVETWKGSCEFLFVNDGSTDGTKDVVTAANANDSRVKLINFSRNFGHQKAVTAGLRQVSGDVIIVMDGDLQDPPEVLPQFLQKIEDGCDVVYAIRRNRKENILLRFLYAAFYRILRMMSSFHIPMDSGDFCVMTRTVTEQINDLPETNRFVRGLRAWVGYRQEGLAYDRQERFTGTPKYTFRQLCSLAMDGLISFSTAPLRLTFLVGMSLTVLSSAYALVIASLKIFNKFELPGFTTLIVLVVFFGGIQMVSIGIIGEYIGRIYKEVKRRPDYIIADTVGINLESSEPDRNR